MLKLIVTNLGRRPKAESARVESVADEVVDRRDADVGAFARPTCCPDADCDEHAYQLGAECDPSDDNKGPPSPAPPSRAELLEQLQLLIDEVASAPPAPSAPPARPAGDEEEHTVKVKTGRGKMREVCRSAIGEDGALVGGCHHCVKSSRVPIQEFAPNAANAQTADKHARFVAACAAFVAARAAGDAEEAARRRGEVEGLRTKLCARCRVVSGKPSPDVLACKLEYMRMQYEACERNNGCQNPACTERGMESWPVLQGDHGTNEKVHHLSEYYWWSWNGGVDAMREEEKRIKQWICGTCHALEKTSSTGKVNDPAKMERGSGQTEREFYIRKHLARITFPKYEYVNDAKRAVGVCQNPGCGRPVLPGTEPGFHWNHRVESTKRRCRCLNEEEKAEGGCHGCPDKLFGRNGGVSGMANNCSKAATLEKVQDLLDEEMNKCDLLCVACHVTRLPRGIGRREILPDPRPARSEGGAASSSSSGGVASSSTAPAPAEAEEDEDEELQQLEEQRARHAFARASRVYGSSPCHLMAIEGHGEPWKLWLVQNC